MRPRCQCWSSLCRAVVPASRVAALPSDCSRPINRPCLTVYVSCPAAQTSKTITVYGDVNAEAMQRLLSLARAKKTTVTGALSAAIAHATAAVLAADGAGGSETPVLYPVALATAVDTRRLYQPQLPAHSLGYHVSGLMQVQREFGVRRGGRRAVVVVDGFGAKQDKQILPPPPSRCVLLYRQPLADSDLTAALWARAVDTRRFMEAALAAEVLHTVVTPQVALTHRLFARVAYTGPRTL